MFGSFGGELTFPVNIMDVVGRAMVLSAMQDLSKIRLALAPMAPSRAEHGLPLDTRPQPPLPFVLPQP